LIATLRKRLGCGKGNSFAWAEATRAERRSDITRARGSLTENGAQRDDSNANRGVTVFMEMEEIAKKAQIWGKRGGGGCGGIHRKKGPHRQDRSTSREMLFVKPSEKPDGKGGVEGMSLEGGLRAALTCAFMVPRKRRDHGKQESHRDPRLPDHLRGRTVHALKCRSPH